MNSFRGVDSQIETRKSNIETVKRLYDEDEARLVHARVGSGGSYCSASTVAESVTVPWFN